VAHPAQRRWYPLVFAIAALVLLPLSVLLLSWQTIDQQIWSHLWDTQMSRLLGNTLTLVLGVGVGVTVLGVSLAWLTSLCEFPGRRWLDWALMLPFAIPAYVLAFVFVGLLDFAGPVQTLLREWFGTGMRLPRVRSTGGVILVLVLVFYPYVYLLARTAFLAQGKGLMEAARVLGQSPWQAFWRVALPMARPAIGAGVALALMETLADFGAVSVFNFDTFTTAIYKTWYGFFSLSTAAQLASLLLLVVMLVLYGERRARGANRASNERPRVKALYHLQGVKALLASGWCGLVFACAFVIPMLQLLVWFWQRGRFDLDERYTGLIVHTLVPGRDGGVDHRQRRDGPGVRPTPGANPRDSRRGQPGQSWLCLARFGVGGVDHAGVQLSGPRAGGPALRLARRRRQAAVAGQSCCACCWPIWCASSPWPTGRWKAAWRVYGHLCPKRHVAWASVGRDCFSKCICRYCFPVR
jgi:iron(III) transport system permease protein